MNVSSSQEGGSVSSSEYSQYSPLQPGNPLLFLPGYAVGPISGGSQQHDRGEEEDVHSSARLLLIKRANH